MGDRFKPFTFDIVVKDKTKDEKIRDDVTVYLKDWENNPTTDNEWVVELPVGARVYITEHDPDNPYIDPSYIVKEETSVDGGENISGGTYDANERKYAFTVPNKDCVVTYTNEFDIKVDTGINDSVFPYWILLGLTGLAGVFLLMGRRRRREI